jgi:hypothetical protein
MHLTCKRADLSQKTGARQVHRKKVICPTNELSHEPVVHLQHYRRKVTRPALVYLVHFNVQTHQKHRTSCLIPMSIQNSSGTLLLHHAGSHYMVCANRLLGVP